MKRLYAGPFVGEFGWELFCWQGYLRKLSHEYDETYVACRKGNEILYKDFAKVIPQDIQCQECDMWDCKTYCPPSFVQIFDRAQGNAPWLEPKKPVLRYDHTHKLDKQPLFAKFQYQQFIRFGDTKPDFPLYDLVVHARAKSNKVNAGMDSNYRNWPVDNWAKCLEPFQDKKIAWIGTKTGAHYINDIGDDLRGIALEALADVLRNSRVIVGPSSGPIHFAALCGCPQIVWWGDPYAEYNRCRFEKDWNPFDTPVTAIHRPQWNPKPDTIAAEIKKFTG